MSSSYRRRLREGMVLVLFAGLCRPLHAGEPAGPAPDAKRLAALWDDLASPDRPKAVAAVLKLIEHGEPAVAFLAPKLQVKRAPVDPKRVAGLIRDLDANDWRRREKAQKDLAGMGRAVMPFLRDHLGKDPTPEVKARIEAILAELTAAGASDPASVQRRRAMGVLVRVGSPKAVEALAALRDAAVDAEKHWANVAMLNVAERLLPSLLDAAGDEARKGNHAAAAATCRKALALAEKADHYAAGRIRAVMAYLRAAEKGEKPPADVAAKLANPAAGKKQPIDARLGWALVRGPNVLGNAGFEIKQVQGIWPIQTGVWGGDMGTIVPAEQGIRPRDGKQMLRFHHCNFRSSSSANGSQICQVVDLSTCRKAVRAGTVRLVASARYNRVAGTARTDTLMAISLYAYSGSPARHFALSQARAQIGQAGVSVHTDANAATWQKVAVSLRVPKNADFVAVQLMASEDIHNDTQGVEFDGHYADAAFVTLVTDAGEHIVPPPAKAPPARPAAGQRRSQPRPGVVPRRNRASRALITTATTQRSRR